MLVYVDEQPFETKLESEGIIDDLVEEVRASLVGTDLLVMGIRADGLDIAGDDYGETLTKPLESFGRYDFTIADPQRVVCSALLECQDLLAAASTKRAEAVDLFTKGASNDGIRVLGDCCRNWHRVHQAICHAIGLLKIDPDSLMIAGKPVAAVMEEALSQLGQIREALVARDFVLISDVLQYEFDAIVANWRGAIDAITQTTATGAGTGR